MSPENDYTARQNVEIDQGFKSKLHDLHIPLNLFDFKYCLGISLIFENLFYLSIDLKEPEIPEYFKNAIDHGAPITFI